YVIALLERIDRALGTSLARGRAGRFAAAVERHLLDLVRGNRARLAVLIVATTAAYVSMAAEAWIIMRAVGVPISFTSALAVETFSRVASFASAFIPANLGALEASSVAAVTAVGAAAAGAPLAVARRVRGLFWAGLGLAIYPRARRPIAAAQAGHMESGDRAAGPILLYVPSRSATSVSPLTRLAGLPIAERVLRSGVRAGYARVFMFVGSDHASALRRISNDVHWDIRTAATAAEWRRLLETVPPGTAVTAIAPGTVVSPALLKDAAVMMLAEGERL